MIYLENSELSWKPGKGVPCYTALQRKKTVHERSMSHITSSAQLTTGDTHSIQKCSYGGEPHLSSKCNIITDLTARRAILRGKGKCFACLKSGHSDRRRNIEGSLVCGRIKFSSAVMNQASASFHDKAAKV